MTALTPHVLAPEFDQAPAGTLPAMRVSWNLLAILPACVAPAGPELVEIPEGVGSRLRTAIVFGGARSQVDAQLDLGGITSDVEGVSRALGEAGWQVVPLTQEDATRDGLFATMRSLEALLADTDEPGGDLLVYIAAHGIRARRGAQGEAESVLLGPQAHPADPFASGVPVDDLLQAMADLPLDSATVITDACHVGSSDLRGPTALFAGAGPNERAEGAATSGGAFTQCWVEALSSAADVTGDGQRSLLETIEPTRTCVTERAADGQKPHLALGPDFRDQMLTTAAVSASRAGLLVVDGRAEPTSLHGLPIVPGTVEAVPEGVLEITLGGVTGGQQRVGIRGSQVAQIRRNETGTTELRVPGQRAAPHFEVKVLHQSPDGCGEAEGLDVTDIDGDGRLDVVVGARRCGSTVLLQDEAGALSPRLVTESPAHQPTICDLDADGLPDLLGLGEDGGLVGWLDLLGDRVPIQGLPRTRVHGVNGGVGRALLASVGGGPPTFLHLAGDNAVLEPVSNEFEGYTFSRAQRVGADYLLQGSRGAWLRSGSDETWAVEPLARRGVDESAGPAWATDLNGDGLLDLIHQGGSPSGAVAYLQLPSSPNWYQRWALPGVQLSNRSYRPHPIDVDNDGQTDIFVPTGGSWRGLPLYTLWHQQRDGSLRDVAAEAGVAYGVHVQKVRVADYDDDGRDDIIVLEGSGRLRVFINRTPGPAPRRVTLLGDAIGAQVSLLDAGRNPVHLVSSSHLRGRPWGRRAVIYLPRPYGTLGDQVRVLWPDGTHSRVQSTEPEISVEASSSSVPVRVGRVEIDIVSGRQTTLPLPPGSVAWRMGGWSYQNNASAGPGSWWHPDGEARPIPAPDGCAWATALPIGVLSGCQDPEGTHIYLDTDEVLHDSPVRYLRKSAQVGDTVWMSFNDSLGLHAYATPDLRPLPERDIGSRPGDHSRREDVLALPGDRLLAVDGESPPALELWDVSAEPRLLQVVEGPGQLGEDPRTPRWEPDPSGAAQRGRIWLLSRFALEVHDLQGSPVRIPLPVSGRDLLLLPEARLAVVLVDHLPARLIVVDMDRLTLMDDFSIGDEHWQAGLAEVP
jgi:hypothetical protein